VAGYTDATPCCPAVQSLLVTVHEDIFAISMIFQLFCDKNFSNDEEKPVNKNPKFVAAGRYMLIPIGSCNDSAGAVNCNDDKMS
jgi:hypothetical protein